MEFTVFCVFVTVTAVDVVLLSRGVMGGRRRLLLMKPHNKMIITTTMMIKMIGTVTPVTIETAAVKNIALTSQSDKVQ